MAKFVPNTIPTAGEDPFLAIPSENLKTPNSLSRPLSTTSRNSDESRMDGRNAEDGETGMILIGLDTNDAVTVGTTVSRPSSCVTDPPCLSETNNSKHDDIINENIESNESKNDDN